MHGSSRNEARFEPMDAPGALDACAEMGIPRTLVSCALRVGAHPFHRLARRTERLRVLCELRLQLELEGVRLVGLLREGEGVGGSLVS
jgi:hypothetical protein